MCLRFVFIILLFHSFLGDALQEKHYLHFKFTALSKANTLPEFSAEAVADDRQIIHYNNEDQSWVRSSLTEDDWTEAPALPPDSRDWFIHQMKTLSNCTNTQCSELHVLQRIIGCELKKLPDGTMNLTVFDEYGFDGEDFIAFNSGTLQWIDKNPKAKETKIKWDQQTKRNELLQHFLKTCMNWISTFNNMKKTPPDVHVFVRKAPDDQNKQVLTCLATGFYPRDIKMNIRLYRNIIKDQTSSEIRPNADGSFQMRSSVEIDRNHKDFYDCFVIHSSLTEPAVVEWEKHYLHFKFTALSKANTLPEFSAEAVADGRQIIHYNNEDQSWVRSSLTEDDWTEAPALPPDSRDWFIHQRKTLSNCTNTQCSEFHVLQRIIGCEMKKLPDGTESLRAFDEYGFDGEDFITFNFGTLQWIDKNPKAKETKMKWDQQTKRNELLQHYLKTCMNWISTFNNTQKTPPDVHVFVRKAPDDQCKLVLSCLVTGFYPRDIKMNIRLYRNIIKDQTSSEIRPNADGSFQMRSSVEIDRNHKEFYDCFVIHSSLTEPAVVEWDGNYADCETESQWALKAVLITVSVVLVLIVSYCIYRRKLLNGGQSSGYGDRTRREMRTEHHPSHKGQKSSYDVENGAKMSLHSDREEMSSPESKRRVWYFKNGSSPHTNISGSPRCEQLVFCTS
uniref:Ig-like domain-containing protein n=1 Tax=Cyprinus carpio carpio TaxID=630221 RepID=A0A8C1A6S5_CYPCA